MKKNLSGGMSVPEVQSKDDLHINRNADTWNDSDERRGTRFPAAQIFFFLAIILHGCASPRYDSQGNGTWPLDKIERAAIHAVNQEHY